MSNPPTTNKKPIARILIDWSKALGAVLVIIGTIAAIYPIITDKTILQNEPDVRYSISNMMRVNDEYIIGLSILNRGSVDAEDVKIQIVYRDPDIKSYYCIDERFDIQPLCEKSQDNRTLFLEFEKIAKQEQDQDNLQKWGSITIFTTRITEKPQITCLIPSGNCKEGIYRRNTIDLFLILLSAFFSLFLVIRYGPNVFRKLFSIKI